MAKSEAMKEALKALFGEPESAAHCMPAPVGCGRFCSEEEFMTWKPIDLTEFRISHLCPECYASIMGGSDE